MLEQFLSKQMGEQITNLQRLSDGLFSQAYSFTADEKEYVVRLNKHEKDFKKDIYAYQNFGDKLPIPKIIKYGKYNDVLYCAITPKCKGVTHDELDHEAAKKVLPEIIKSVEIMRLIDVSETSGYGLLDENGKSEHDHWNSAIMFFYNHKFPKIDVERLLKNSILNKTFFEKHLKRLLKLLKFIPKERHLIHGDFGFDNLIVDNDKITGILDWAESRYGDFLYDVAWLDFWSNNIEYAKEFKKYYSANNISIPHYNKRIECYRLHIGLNSLILAAYLDNEQDYEQITKKLKK